MSSAATSVRIGLIGLGKMGQNHLRVLSMMKGVELCFVYDFDRAAVAKAATAYGVATGDDLEALLPLADAVVICTPTSTHGEYVRIAAKHVRNIFVEKPLAHTLEETQELARFADAEGLNIQVGFIERFNPAVLQLKSVVDRSEQIISVDFTRTNKLSARITDVDVVSDLMIHDIDLAIHLNGPVESVTAHGVADGDMINFASAMLRHAGGRLSRIQASRITEKKMRVINATCSDMFVNCELVRKELVINRQSQISKQADGAYTISAIEEMVDVRHEEALLSELLAFVSFCTTGKPAGPGVADAVAAAHVCDRIQQEILQAAH